ncbi:hypothetical protein [uncultured Prevotella sp.]|jgi:hypothetical protein|uniref:hypothetical protein n=1 Tax=uncultured Prevotella sp. TaxID=159272 RepID=UPI0027E248C9|nr:hypothetical protein [uncultured Prevotella sp.]
MNEEILKEAVNKGSYLSYHWRQYTFEQLEKETNNCNQETSASTYERNVQG